MRVPLYVSQLSYILFLYHTLSLVDTRAYTHGRDTYHTGLFYIIISATAVALWNCKEVMFYLRKTLYKRRYKDLCQAQLEHHHVTNDKCYYQRIVNVPSWLTFCPTNFKSIEIISTVCTLSS